MRTTIIRRIHLILAMVLVAAVAPVALTTAATAQETQELDPAADFRTAPLVGDGTYRVEMVSGERVWVSVLYTDRTELSISARLTDVDADQVEGLTLWRAIVGPNLGLLTADTEDIGNGYNMWWDGGETDTNLWFIPFTLETTGQVGVRHTLEFTLRGFEDVGSNEPCDDDCTLDDDLGEAEDEIAELEADLEDCGEECDNPSTQEELETERDQVAAGIRSVESEISDLCGGELCDELPTKSTTPWLFVLLAGLAALVVLGGLTRTLIKRREGAT